MTQTTPLPPAAPAIPPKPGYVQAIAIMCLVDGILNVLAGFGLVVGLLCSVFLACCAPLGVYPLVLGILEIVYASQLLPEQVCAVRPARYLAIMQIVNIVCSGVISLVIGILSLVFYSDAKVTEYFRAVECRRMCR
jgi:hypothetical protein